MRQRQRIEFVCSDFDTGRYTLQISRLGRFSAMEKTAVLDAISRGRTDFVHQILRQPDWKSVLCEGRITPMQWFVYYNDVTAIKVVLEAGGDLDSISLDEELGNAAFFGHFQMCDFLILHGADASFIDPATGETPLHNALVKADRPYYIFVVRLLLEHGADPNAATKPGQESAAFMRDVRTCGETPLHRAAAFSSAEIIQILLDSGADREVRDAHGNSPLSWASLHLRPGKILSQLAFGPHRIGERSRQQITSDHGMGWGNGMDWSLHGEYLPESTSPSV